MANSTLYGLRQTALENSEVSPVLSLVAVLVMYSSGWYAAGGSKLIVAKPLALVVTIVEPRYIWPSKKPEGSGTAAEELDQERCSAALVSSP